MLNPIKFKDISFLKRLKPFPNYLNLWAIEDNAVIGVDLQMSFVYELAGVDILHLSENEIEIFYQHLRNFLHSFPDRITIQFVVSQRYGDKKRVARWRDSIKTSDELSRFISGEKLKDYNKNNYLKKTILLYITIYPEKISLTKYITPPIFQLFNPNPKELEGFHKSQIERLKTISGTVISSLRLAGAEPRQLEKNEIMEFLYQYLNPGRSEKIDFNFNNFSSEMTLRSQACYNGAENTFSHFFLDGYYYRGVNLFTRPDILSPYSITQFLKIIPGEYDYVLSIDSVSQDSLIREVGYEGTVGMVLANFHAFKRYPEAERKHKDSQDLIQYVKTNSQKLYRTSFCVITRESSLESLTHNQESILSAYRLFGESEGIIDDGQHLFLFLTTLPNHSQFNLRKEIFHTEAVSMLLPVYQSWRGTKEAKMLFYTKESELIGLDLFDTELPAKHGLILGTTGSGKSFTTNFLLTNFYTGSENNHIIIVDIGGSYKKLCNLLYGEYFEVEMTEKYAFNPFPPKNIAVTDETTGNVDPDILQFLGLFIQKLLQQPTLEPKENLIIETAIKNVYRYSKHPVPTLSALLYQMKNYKEGDEEIQQIARQFAKNIEFWVSGKYGTMLNRETSIDPKARVVAFDLQKLQEHKDLLPLLFFIIQNTIWSKLQDKTLKKLIVFDECWRFFNDEVSARLIENLYRTARKFNAAVYSISQEPNDFLSSAAAGSVLANSYIKYILMLQKGHDILDKFGFNQQEIEEIKNLTSSRRKYSEVFVKFNKNAQVIRIQPTQCDYWICTTDPEDDMRIKTIKNENPGISESDILKKLMEDV